jgi:pentatricopeptide repeat protein
MLSHIVDDFCKGKPGVPSPAAVLLKYQQLDIFRFGRLGMEETDHNRSISSKTAEIGHAWRDTIRFLTHAALLRISGAESGGADTETILTEVLAIWRLLLQCQGSSEIPVESVDTEWSFIPDASTLESAMNPAKPPRDFSKRLEGYHKHLAGNPTLGFSALALFNLLNQRSRNAIPVSETLRTQKEPFVRLLTYILPGSNIQSVFKHVGVAAIFDRIPEDFRTSLLEQISSAPADAMALIGSKEFSEPALSDTERASAQEEYFLKRIERAILQKSVGVSLDKLWNEATSSFRRQDGQTAIPPRIYNNFLTGYLALFSSERSVQVWNHMIQSGIKPDVNAWTAMLTGCERARDLNGVKAVWQRMIRSGIQPDIHAWTTRIHALFSLRVINDGFAAMDEMGRQWLSSEQALNTTAKNGPQASKNQPTVNTVPKPSTDVINGATSGIVKIPTRSLNFDRKAEFVRKILSWAGHFSIKPDARTYNILMNLYMSGNDYPTVFKLLQQMEAEGIEADVATYSMLIRASFDNHKFNDLPEAEQAERITSLFSELEAGGLKLNANLYSSAIDRLLKQYANFAAVRTLIDHMLSRGLIPSPHVYTSLVTQYFSQSPPNIAAVDSLCYQILSSPGTPTDKILFDRIIEGYAGVGEIGKMMAILTKMSKHGKLPGWMALTAVVQALARHGEWDRARMVVADVQRGEGVAKGGITGGMHGEKDFFRTVKSLGLVVQQVHGQAEQAWSQEAGELGAVADEAWRTQRRQPALPAKSHGVHKLDEASMEQAKQPKAHVHEDNGSVGGIPL